MHDFKISNLNSYIPFNFLNQNILPKNSILILETGEKFFGYSFGSEKLGIGELCFNTSMTGYQEIITDPSYTNQIISFTFPHIGNVGTNFNDYEGKSNIVYAPTPTNKHEAETVIKSTKFLNEWLMSKKHNVFECILNIRS